jgi:hypothetical protein
MRCLVVFYSFSGTTRRVAEAAAHDLAADISEVHAPRYATGSFRYLRAAFDSWRGRLPAIEVRGAQPDDYDFVLLLAPVWVGHAATPMRAYAAQARGRLKRATFVLTCGGSCPPRAFDELMALAGVRPEATLMLFDRDIKTSAGCPPAMTSLLASLKLKAAV